MQAQPTFSRQHGFCEEPFDLTIGGAEGQAVHYTLDGSEPSPSSPVYAQPLTIS